MSERKVLNKYYPPDFDPSKIPRMKLPKNRQYTVRLMAPCNMRCKTCGEYIYKGKKFNARKEDVEGEDYLGIRIYRFYIKCTRCLQEISFKTDPRNTDYEIEAGATRNFMALKLAEEQAQREEDERKEEEATNPMKLLENRTQQSKQELELLESLEELKDLNRRQQSIDYDTMLLQYNDKEAMERLVKKQKEDDEKLIKSLYGSGSKRVIEEQIIEDEEFNSGVATQDDGRPPSKVLKAETNVAASTSSSQSSTAKPGSWSKSVGIMKRSNGLAGLVRKKPPASISVAPQLVKATKTDPTVSISSPDNCSKETSLTVQSVPDCKPSTDKESNPVSKPISGLSLLGTYSDSASDSDN